MSLPFLTTKSLEQLASVSKHKKTGRKPSYTPYDRRLSDMYRWQKNWYRRKREQAKREGKLYEGLEFQMSKEEWMRMWKELIPPLPIDFPLNGVKNLGNTYVRHVPAWTFRSLRPLVRSQETIEVVESRVVGGGPANAATDAPRRLQSALQAREAWEEQRILTPAFKLHLKKIDSYKPFKLENLKLVCIEVGDRKLGMGEDRREQELWRYGL